MCVCGFAWATVAHTKKCHGGLQALKAERGAAYLAMQRESFASTEWRDADDGSVTCGGSDGGSCVYSVTMAPPSVAAVWIRIQ